MDFYNQNDFNFLKNTPQAGNAGQLGVGFGSNQRSANQNKQNAFQALAMLRLLQSGQRNKAMQGYQEGIAQLGQQAQQANVFDYTGAALAGINAAAAKSDEYNYDPYGLKNQKQKKDPNLYYSWEQ